MRIAQIRMRIRNGWRDSSISLSALHFKVTALLVLSLFAFVCYPLSLNAEETVRVRITLNPSAPAPLLDELIDIFTDTLTQVLTEDKVNGALSTLDPAVIADGIKTGLNVLLQPKGFWVSNLTLDFDSTPVTADITIYPVGWTEQDPQVTDSVVIHLDDTGLDPFWLDRMNARLAENETRLKNYYNIYLLNLPLNAIDRDWLLGLVLPDLVQTDPAPDIFIGFSVSHTIDISNPEAMLTLHLEPDTRVIELIRTRMYSHTLYNMILDRFRELVFAEAGMIRGMPISLVEDSLDELAEHLITAIENHELADIFNAYTSVVLEVLPDAPVLRIDVIVESRLFDLQLETFVDFGNEYHDSAEIQARFGLLAARGIEALVNLNFFTNDLTLETDVALGLRPARGTFVAIGYDLERESPKYFFEQEFSTGLILRGEIFEHDTLNEFGICYQFQQYLSVGMFSNGDNDYWVRAIFKL